MSSLSYRLQLKFLRVGFATITYAAVNAIAHFLSVGLFANISI